MFYNIDLEVWLALTTAFTLFIPALVAQTDTYIIHMDVSAMPKAFSTQHSWHLATLSSVFTDSTATTSISAAAAASSKLLYSYTHAINGFSACLTPWELDILKASPGYISAFKDVRVEADTTRSTSFLGLNPKSRAWKNSNYGEGMIIGVVDSGVWPESESYSDKGMSSIPKRWRGECESGTQFNSSLCNKKLIGARSFNKGVIANDPNVTISMNSTRDTDGHGTHTSSTAAGNFVEGASYFGYAMGTARGVAPRSHVAVYKALWDEGTFASDIIAAIDQAIIDQVDVLSISLSVFGVPFYEDPIALATFAAVQKNIVVAGSAGNRGSSILTIRNAAPWVLTVAASTIDRKFNAVMKLGDGVTVTGLAIYPLDFPSRKLPIVFTNGACSTVAEFSDFDKSVVVCEETIDTSLEIQFGTVGATNVTGGVFITNSTEFDSSLPSRFPAIFLNFQNGQKLKKYINASTSPQVSIKFKRNSVRNTAAPSVAAYSSRGPSRIIPEVLKPDIMAPGTQILAAWPSNDCSSPSLDINYPSFIAFFNGEESESNLTTVKEFHRTVTNVGDAISTYTASWTQASSSRSKEDRGIPSFRST